MRARSPAFAAFAISLAACAPAAPPAEPAPLPPPVVTAAPEPPPTAPSAPAPPPSASPPPSAAPNHGPPPKPPMAVRWSFHMSRYGGHPGKTMRLSIDEEGKGSYEVEEGENGYRCNARVAPDLHQKVVEAARDAVTGGGCDKGPPKREMPQASIAVTVAGKTTSCAVSREGTRYGTFHAALDLVTEVLCRR